MRQTETRKAQHRGFAIQIRVIPVRDPDRWIGMVRVWDRSGPTVEVKGEWEAGEFPSAEVGIEASLDYAKRLIDSWLDE